MKQAESPDTHTGLKWLVSAIAVAMFAVRLAFPEIRIDAVSFGLLLLAVLPWLSPLIKSAKLPGGIEIEFQDVKQAADKVAAAAPPSLAPAPTEPAFLAIAEQDPNLALVGLRIEIEKRLRALAEQAGIPPRRSLVQLTTDLQSKGVLDFQAAGGLRDLIALGNQAAHGTKVAPDVALSAADYGPPVLRTLDLKLQQGSTGAA